MSADTYNALTNILLSGSLFALALALLYLIAAIIGWKGPHRKARLLRFVGFLVLFPGLVLAQQTLQYRIYMPLLRQAGDREMLERRREMFAVSTNVAVGDAAPAFELTDADGQVVRLSDLRGRVVLLNFFATWCGPCMLELPRMQKIWERYRHNDKFSMLVIGREESLEAVSDFRTKNKYTFPIAPDANREVYSLFAKEIIPRIFLISADGKIIYATMGYDEPELDRLEQLLRDSLEADLR